MSKFLEVANTFREAIDADAEDLKALRDAATELRKKFSDYLEVPSGNPVNINGIDGPHVAIGEIDENGFFKGVPKKKFSRSAGSRIRFAILFTYDPDPKPKTQGAILFPLEMELTRGGFKVWLNEIDVFHVTLEDMTPLFEALYERSLAKARSAIE